MTLPVSSPFLEKDTPTVVVTPIDETKEDPDFNNTNKEMNTSTTLHKPSPLAKPLSIFQKPTYVEMPPGMTDVEKGASLYLSPSLSTPKYPREGTQSPLYAPCTAFSFDAHMKECTMWPSKTTLEQKAQLEKTSRTTGIGRFWSCRSRKHKLWIRVIIGVLVVAIAVAIAVGVSRAVGGGINHA